MLSQSKNALLEAVYRFGGYVTVPAVMAWKHISDTGARKSINALCSLGYLEEVEFSNIKNYPVIYRITGAGIFYLRKHTVRDVSSIYAYSILYKVIKSHAFFELAGSGAAEILTENTKKIHYLKSMGFTKFDQHSANGTAYPIFSDYIIKEKPGFTSLYIDRGYGNVRHVLETRLIHLKNFIKDDRVPISIMIITDRVDRKEAFLWAYDAEYGIAKPENFTCRQLSYCYSRA